jgi:diguanylate cyclase (GGDEF)-like protein
VAGPLKNENGKLGWLWGQPLYRRLTAPYAIVVAGLAIALFMVAICAVALYQSRLDAMARATDASRNLALIAERDIERNFELYALSLQAVVDGVGDPEVMGAGPRLRNMVLFDRAASASYLGSMLVLDAKGNIAIDSASDVPRKDNFSDREFFKVQRDNPDLGLYISAPYSASLHGSEHCIALTRRISRPDGSFAGVAMGTIDLTYFRKLFGALSLGPNGSVALIGRDGLMIMRQPYDVQVVGRSIRTASTFRRFVSTPEGSFSDTSTLDGARRLYYFKNFPNLPLIIMVAEAHSDIFAAWQRRALMIGSLIAAFATGLIALSFALSAQVRRRMRAESELTMLARTDGLTGLHNRRTLGEILELEWRRARRERSVFSLLFVDLDRFKAYNDTYGHLAGDDALSAVARCIGENIRRPADSAARYGGEEFVVVLPNTSPEGAASIAEKIRTAISDLSIDHAGSEYGRITASIGAAGWMPEEDGDVAAVVRAADEALYKAKANGRNKVALAAGNPV